MTPLTPHQRHLHSLQEALYAPYLEMWASISAHAASRQHAVHKLWRDFYADEAERARQRMLYHLTITPTMAERRQCSALNPSD